MKKVFFYALVFLPFFVSAQLKINEIMPKNVSAIMDDAYNYSMWVELYNSSTTTSYNQAYYYFTDDLSKPSKWKVGSKVIAAGGFSLLYFERPERAGHATFKLEPDGGKLYMLNFSLQVVDSVIYPAQYRNVSYGRLLDGGKDWVYFEQFSAGASNNGKFSASLRCDEPVFSMQSGFYPSAINITFNPLPGDTIYYTRNGSEPNKLNSTRYPERTSIYISATSVIRAKCFSAKKLSSNIVSSTFFIGERNFKLPVVSISTTPANLTDKTIGIYVVGTNGLTGNGMSTPANWNQDWDRPVNFELFDTTRTSRLNQEVDINIAGGWSRMNDQKSIKINAKKKFGENRLAYDFFPMTKPNLKYKSILLRNSGNDFQYTMMRDAFMQSLVAKRMNLDCSAYEPAVCFMNGVYYGIQNLRERSDVDFVFSNYGYDETQIRLVETGEMATDTSFLKLSDYIKSNDITKPAVYATASTMMDMDNFMSYFISEIYFGNTDWPNNNIKAWKTIVNGKWRWIMYDTDFGFSLFDTGLYTHNTLLYALGEKSDQIPPDWSTLLLRRLMLNDTFRNKFIDRFSIQLSSTFDSGRVIHMMDSIAAKISTEIVYHKNKWGSARDFVSDINNMKLFSLNRVSAMFGFLTSRFLNSTAIQTVNISSNNPKASYTLNTEPIMDANINLKYYNGRTMTLEAKPIPAYKFKQWELTKSLIATTLIANSSDWKYNDGSAMPASNWFSPAYSDAAWKTGTAPLGYVSGGVVTTIGYGGVTTNKYPTAYFRKTISLSNVSLKSNYVVTAFVDDGMALYVNGTEVGRSNLPTGALAFTTLAPTSNNGITATFVVPQNLLKEGNNVIAVEVHQNAVTSSDLIFNLQMTCDVADIVATTNPVYTTTLSGDMKLKAVYEQTSVVDPDKNLNVVINEVVSSNNQLADEYGGKDDYIELYNGGSSSANVAGWYLTDKPSNRTLAQIPATDTTKTFIPAKGRIVIWADNEATQGPLHVGFKLSQSGETVVLSKINYLGNLMTVDSLSFPYLAANMSYARVPDGSQNWVVQVPTLNTTNDNTSAVPQIYSTIALYPTLVREALTVEHASGLQLQIADLTGKILMQHPCESDFERIGVGQLQRGVYIVTVGNANFKIVKM
jgi:hypothetical protein